MEIDIKNRQDVIIKFKETWEEFRQALGQGVINYKDLAQAREYTFLKVLEGVLQYKSNNHDINETFNTLYFNYSFCRATKKNITESKKDLTTPERFLPKTKYITDHNRFSPIGIEYLYLACKPRFGKERNYKYIEEVSLKEIRAEEGNAYGICKFEIPSTIASSDKKVINLTIADNKSFEQIEKDFCEKSDDYVFENFMNFLNPNGIIKREDLSDFCIEISRKFALNIYFKILSSELFKPIENPKDKNFEYAPFHCLAEYFKQLGYDGIIYKSTVCDNGYGKNIVLFDKYLATPLSDIKIVNSNNEEIEIE